MTKVTISVTDNIGVKLLGNNDFIQLKNLKPDKDTAKALLEFMAMDEGKAKENLKLLCEKEISNYNIWLNSYCSKNNCTQEEALNQIIERKI